MLGGGALTIAGVLTTVVAPLLADALGAAGLDNAGIGAHLTALHLAQMVVIFGLTGSRLVARLERRATGLVGCLVSAAALSAAAVSTSSQLPTLEMIVVGLGAGLAYAGCASTLSFAHDAERALFDRHHRVHRHRRGGAGRLGSGAGRTQPSGHLRGHRRGAGHARGGRAAPSAPGDRTAPSSSPRHRRRTLRIAVGSAGRASP